MRRLGLALVLFACHPAESPTPLATGLTGSQARAMAACDAAPRLQRDWCAVHVMEGNSAEPGEVRGTWGSGERVHEICTRLIEPSARDWCLELAARSQEPQPPADVCDGIRDAALQRSCHLAMADRLASASAAVELIAEHCAASGPLLPNCLYHIPARRISHYRKQGKDALATETRALIERLPAATGLAPFGIAVARAAHTLSIEAGSANDPCVTLPPGEAASSCSFTLLYPEQHWASPGTTAGSLE